MLEICDKKYIKITLVTLIFIIALTGRLIYSLLIPEPFVKGSFPFGKGLGSFGDTHLYHRIAYNLYNGNGFSGTFSAEAYGIPLYEVNKFEPSAARGPVYPFFVSLVYKFCCNSEDMESADTWYKCWNRIRIAQCILDSIVCFIVFLIVRSLIPASFLPAIISACLYCISLYNIYWTKVLMSESVTTFLLALTILFFINALKINNIYRWIPAGIGLGIIILSRPEYILSVFVLGAFIFWVNRSLPFNAMKKSLIFIFCVFLIISPWALRNYIIFKKPIIVAASGIGFNLFIGTWQSKDNWRWGAFPREIFETENEAKKANALRADYVHELNKGSVEIKSFDEAFKVMALERIRDNPGKTFLRWIKRIPGLWYQNPLQLYPVRDPPGIFFVFYFLFAAYAFAGSNREEKTLMGPVILLFFYLTLIFLPLPIEPRYGVALMPGIISLAGIGIWKTILHFKSILETKKV